MFKFLKEKLKSAVSFFSKKVEDLPESKEEVKTEEKLEPKEEKKKVRKQEPVKVEKDSIVWEDKHRISEDVVKEIKAKEVKEEEKGFFSKLKEKIIGKEETKEEEKKGFFDIITEKITTKKISEEKFDELFWDLELAMLENNVAVEVIEKIKKDLKERLVNVPIKRNEVEKIIDLSLMESIEEVLNFDGIDLIKEIKDKKEKPYIIVFFGTNGAGKTTTLCKIARLCLNNKLAVVFGAADCFRKGSIEQLEEWAKRLGVKVVKHEYGSDPAAVSFDTIAMAKAHKIDVVLIDTAGRQHSNINLLEEMKKIVKVAKPDLKILVSESLVGNDAIEQARRFNNSIGIDGVILTKSDVDEKGGAIISMSYVIRKPILYLGVGQGENDLKEFNKEYILNQLNL